MRVPFRQLLEVGQIGESVIARWLRQRGNFVLPVYETMAEFKGPRLFTPTSYQQTELIAPDMLVFRPHQEQPLWIEAKHKDTFTWHRKSRNWQTGIDQKYWLDYLQIQASISWDIWLLFLHRGGQDKDTGEQSPSGLFGEKLTTLKSKIHHTCPPCEMGSGGMVFWNYQDLKQLATMSELQNSC
jgi:hypothetical protein